ncbi:uncharacterized protein LOC142905826 isoform X2 [Petromyzon marinus]|uniref:uncharacterized protein LOC142905826 isoform X2 n=1 Tax=Petromyzon marinus TaxID=7757 RepID=UPI003F716E0F
MVNSWEGTPTAPATHFPFGVSTESRDLHCRSTHGMARTCVCLLLSLAAAAAAAAEVGYQAKDETDVRVERLGQHVNETEFVYIRHAYVHTATRIRDDAKRAAAAAATTASASAAGATAAGAAACHHTFVVPPHLPAGPICVLQEGAGAPPEAGTPAGIAAAAAAVDKFWAELGTHGRQLALLQRQLSDLDDSTEIGEKFEEDLVVAAAAAAAAAAAGGGGDGGATGGGGVGLRAAVQALRRAGRAVGERVTALYARILRETVLDRGGSGGGDYGGGGQGGSRQGRTLQVARTELHKRVSEQETHSLGLHGHYARIQSTYDSLSETVGNHTATLARLGLRCCRQRPLDAQPPPTDPRRATDGARGPPSTPSAERGADGGGAVASPIPSPDRAWRATANGGGSAGSETSYGCGGGGGGGSGGDAAGRLATGEREKGARGSERTPAVGTQTARRQHGLTDGWAGKQGLSAVDGGANWAPGSDGGPEVGNRGGGGGAAAAPDNAVMRHGSRGAAVPPAPDGAAVRTTEKPHVVLEGPWRDCQEAWDAGYRRSGRYLLRPAAGSPLLRHAWCDQERDPGGWTVVQRRSDGSVSFTRDWDAYKIGFGRVEEEHWLGLQTMHALTSERNYRLLVALQDWDGRRAFAEYGSFRVESEEDNYRLRLGHFRGMAGDSMGLHHGKPFSTYDRDNDAFRGNCAQHQKGGWWYNACSHANLNGVWYEGGRYTGSEQDGAYWTTFRGTAYSLKSIVLMIRPNPNFYH